MVRYSKSAVTVLLTATITVLPAQSHKFNLDQFDTTNYNTAADFVMRGIGISLGHQPLFSNDPVARLKLGFTISRPVYSLPSNTDNQLSGLLPKFDFGFLVTSNLLIKGSLAALSMESDIIRITAYGGTLFLNSDKNKSPWMLNVLLSELNGPEDIALRSKDVLLRRRYQMGRLPLYLGIGADFYSGRATPQTLPGRRFSGQTNYFYISEQFQIGNLITAGFHLRYHPEMILLAVDLKRELK